MTGRPLIGLLLALVIEASHWTRLRWDFDDDSCGRAWQVTSIAIGVAAGLIWLDGNRYTALPGLLSWMPPLLLPVQFVQSYGMRSSLPLSTFSFLARHRRERNQRLGLIEETTTFNFGNVLFVTSMVASSVGSKADSRMFLPGIVVLTGWLFLAAGRSRPLTLIPVIAVAGLLGWAGELGLRRAAEWFSGTANSDRGRFDPNFVSTLIGTRGTVEQSPDIIWRLRLMGKNPPPVLLRTGAFNNFLGTNWQNQRVALTDFKDLDTRLIGEQAFFLLQDADQAEKLVELPYFTLRGAAAAESPLPLPGDVAGLRDFELDGIERNSFGTIRVFPKQSVIDGTVFWRGGTNPETPPLPHEDLRIPIAEEKDGAIRDAVSRLHLDAAPDLRGKLALLRAWFHGEFRYSRDLTIQRPTNEQRLDEIRDPTPMAEFLNDVRAGHCEYFATAATLMLREAGIPARYATGYAIMERDTKRDEFVIRGTHGHAWCRVWDETTGTWLDFDPTPPDWFATVAPQPSAIQRFNDNLKRLREDFFVWRNRPSNRLAVSFGMIGVGLVLTGFFARRLWRSKRRVAAAGAAGDCYDGLIIRTPLHRLEAKARKHLGPRPPGQPFGEWLARLRGSLPDSPDLDEAIALHQRMRFDPVPSAAAHRERLATLVRQIESALRHQ